jgi:hypothetical protein
MRRTSVCCRTVALLVTLFGVVIVINMFRTGFDGDCDVHPEALRTWVKQAEADEGARPTATSTDAARVAELEREVRELRRANHILKSAASFFAAELDRPSR